METAKFILIGGGGHARVVSSIIEAQENSHLEGVFDSNSKIETLDGVENFHKYNPDQFPNAIAIVAIGDNKKKLSLTEKIYKEYRRSIYVVKDIKKGELLTKKNIKVIRPGKGLDARKFEDLLGKKSKKFMKLGSPLNFKVR